MKNTKITFFIIILLIAIGAYLYTTKESTPPQEVMSITLYVQDKEAARTSDCRVTQKITYQVPMTSNIPDAALRMLFSDELSHYGTYDSLTIADGVAKIMVKSNMNSLSSCESGHLLAVLNDTLTQYSTITSVELYSPEGKIDF